MSQYPLNKAIKQHMRSAANILEKDFPFQYAYAMKNVLGRAILDETVKVDHQTVTVDSINPNEVYRVRILTKVPVNHYRRIKKAYLKNGPQGMYDYCQSFKMPKKGLKDKIKSWFGK